MNNELINEISEYIIQTIKDNIHIIYENSVVYLKRDNVNEANTNATIPVQFYYNESTNIIYLYYELDKLTRYTIDPKLCYEKTNNDLLSNFYRDFNKRIEIVRPGGICRSKIYPITADQYEQEITTSTVSYWKCYDGVYRFIEDAKVIAADHNVDFDPFSKDEAVLKEKKFFEKIIELNKKYQFVFENETDLPLGFEEYSNFYYREYGRRLEPIPESDIIRFYIDVYLKEGK